MTIQPKVTTILADFIWLCGSAVKSFYILIQCWTEMTLCCKIWGGQLGSWGECSAWIQQSWFKFQLFHFVLAIYSVAVSDSVNPWTVACQAPLSMRFLRQEYWGGFPFPPPGHLPNPGIKPTSSAYPALAGGFFSSGPSGMPRCVS